MSKTKHYLYGDSLRLPGHLNFGKKVYSNMLKNKDKTALMNADTRSAMTYNVAAKMTADVARKLTGLGVRKGDVVCFCSENNLEYLPTVMGIICAGATCSPMDPTYEHCYVKNAIPDFMDEERFLKTGDVGYYNDDGYIYIVNRIKDLIKFNGNTIAPAEFEALLLQHPSVREAGVVKYDSRPTNMTLQNNTS